MLTAVILTAMRLLVVGFADSVHIARYLQLLQDTDWDIHLFDSTLWGEPHPELPPVTVHTCVADVQESERPGGPLVKSLAFPWSFRGHSDHLARVIDEFRPDIVHSHEIQHGGALVQAALQRDDTPQIPWLVTNWGSDIFWFGRDPFHISTIRAVLQDCDYYSAECHRDVALARAYGLQGRVVGVWPVTGGIDLDHAMTLRASGPTSGRRAIAVKGFSGAIGQAEIAFEAIERCADLLDDWELCTYQLDAKLEERYLNLAAGAVSHHTVISLGGARQSSHDEVLAMHGRARVSLALNRSDALSTSFLEAMAMGSFPVQSSSSCGNEITPPGHGALFVPATDVDTVTAALRRALTDDLLVDTAAEINRQACAEHLDRRRTRARVIDAYERILGDAALKAAA
jgi:glycosyltransferase involved in cell wall biosynthesis